MSLLDAVTAKYRLTIIYADSCEEVEEGRASLSATHYAASLPQQQGLRRSLNENDI